MPALAWWFEMDGVKLADRLAYGAGCVARRVGFVHDAYRPVGPVAPVDLDKRFLRLSVAYVLPGGSVGAPTAFGVPFRQAWADWGYLQVGDYLSGPEGTVFVAAIEPPKPMLVVMTNTVVSLERPAAPALPGLNPYSAVLPANRTVLLTGFPSSVLVGGIDDRTRVGLPDDTKLPGFTALLPMVDAVRPHQADMLLTDRHERFVVTGVETVAGVWRLSMTPVVS
jgi:hypothetical protein